MEYMESKLQQQYEESEAYINAMHPIMDAVENIMKKYNCTIDDIIYSADFIKKTMPPKKQSADEELCSECGRCGCSPGKCNDFIPY